MNQFRFVGGFGGRADDDTGLVYFWNRWYDAGAGRWANEDPARWDAGTNHYEYVFNNPNGSIDPLGLSGTITIFSNGGPNITDGHSWISFSSDQTGSTSTYGTWGNTIPTGLWQNREAGWDAQATRSMYLDDTQESLLYQVINATAADGSGGWSYLNPCSSFAAATWGAATGESLSHRSWGISNPTTLRDSIIAANGGSPHGTKPKNKKKDDGSWCSNSH